MFGFSVAYKNAKTYCLFEMQLLFQNILDFVVYIVRRSVTSGRDLSRDLTPGNSASKLRGCSGEPLATQCLTWTDWKLNPIPPAPLTMSSTTSPTNRFATFSCLYCTLTSRFVSNSLILYNIWRDVYNFIPHGFKFNNLSYLGEYCIAKIIKTNLNTIQLKLKSKK